MDLQQRTTSNRCGSLWVRWHSRSRTWPGHAASGLLLCETVGEHHGISKNKQLQKQLHEHFTKRTCFCFSDFACLFFRQTSPPVSRCPMNGRRHSKYTWNKCNRSSRWMELPFDSNGDQQPFDNRPLDHQDNCWFQCQKQSSESVSLVRVVVGKHDLLRKWWVYVFSSTYTINQDGSSNKKWHLMVQVTSRQGTSRSKGLVGWSPENRCGYCRGGNCRLRCQETIRISLRPWKVLASDSVRWFFSFDDQVKWFDPWNLRQ